MAFCFLPQTGKGSGVKQDMYLKKNGDFQKVYQAGRAIALRTLVMYVLARGKDTPSRIGISVSKKVGNSVIRHRVKRLVKEAYRLHEDMFCSGLDIAVIARTSAKGFSYGEAESALLHLGGLHHIIKKHQHKEDT